MSTPIHSYISRYIVPFYYDYENGGYQKLREHLRLGKWQEEGFWEKGDMDLYSYLPDILKQNPDPSAGEEINLGTSFVYHTGGKLFEARCRTGDKFISFAGTDIGIVLLRNGIGFIWYAVKLPEKETSVEDYVAFQHDFKELARNNGRKFIKDQEGEETPFLMGAWLSGFLSTEKLDIKFWSEKTVKADDKDVNIPDRALLFQYLFLDGATDNETNDLLFRLANGYNDKFNSPSNIDDFVYRPFGNMNFCISKGGMACVAINEKSNEIFFEGAFKGKYVRDYFFMYILLLYQSYSCAHYSRLLSKLPADEKLLNRRHEYVEMLESLNAEINLFLVKSVFESVSNVHHQNGFYRYGKDILHIEEDIQSLTIGLDALKSMEREKRDRKVDIALVVFGFMVVVSAWLDGLNLVDWFKNNGKTIDHWHVGISLVILALTAYLLITLYRTKRK